MHVHEKRDHKDVTKEKRLRNISSRQRTKAGGTVNGNTHTGMTVTATSQSTMGTTGIWTWCELADSSDDHLFRRDANHVIPNQKFSALGGPALPAHASSSAITPPLAMNTTKHQPAFHSMPASAGLASWTAGSTWYGTTTNTCTKTTTTLTSPSQSSSSSSSVPSVSSSSLTTSAAVDPVSFTNSHPREPSEATVISNSFDLCPSHSNATDYTLGSCSGASTRQNLPVGIIQPDAYDPSTHGQWSTFHSPSSVQLCRISEQSGRMDIDGCASEHLVQSPPKVSNHILDSKHQWDIKDVKLPKVTSFDTYDQWPTGHCRRVYPQSCERARRHQSGWAMRNTNNHNPQVLKKSCLGVLECSVGCMVQGKPLSLRPAICDKARKKQTRSIASSSGGLLGGDQTGSRGLLFPGLPQAAELLPGLVSSALNGPVNAVSVDMLCLPTVSSNMGQKLTGQKLSGYSHRSAFRMEKKTGRSVADRREKRSTLTGNKLPRIIGAQKPVSGMIDWDHTQARSMIGPKRARRGVRRKLIPDDMDNILVHGDVMSHMISPFGSIQTAQTPPLPSIQPIQLSSYSCSQICTTSSQISPTASYYPPIQGSQSEWQSGIFSQPQSAVSLQVLRMNEEHTTLESMSEVIPTHATYDNAPTGSIPYQSDSTIPVTSCTVPTLVFGSDMPHSTETSNLFCLSFPSNHTPPNLSSSTAPIQIDNGAQITSDYSSLPVGMTYTSLSRTHSSYSSDHPIRLIDQLSPNKCEFNPVHQTPDWYMPTSPPGRTPITPASCVVHSSLWPTDRSEQTCYPITLEESSIPTHTDESVDCCQTVPPEHNADCFSTYHPYTWPSEQSRPEHSVSSSEPSTIHYPIEIAQDPNSMEVSHLRDWLSHDPQTDIEWNPWSGPANNSTTTDEMNVNFTAGFAWPTNLYTAGMNTDSQVVEIPDGEDWFITSTTTGQTIIPGAETSLTSSASANIGVMESPKQNTRIPAMDEFLVTMNPNLSGSNPLSDHEPCSRASYLTNCSDGVSIQWTDTDLVSIEPWLRE
ncbi:unnamed protein product [Echinostoma caproni]|uniref:GCM domain-containing protein n=1 Tax=Echinostoma caproni TaxID=27848 RepID=A0A183AC97_9TREM|nr:unnamed protein product [Echinostoma caproni]